MVFSQIRNSKEKSRDFSDCLFPDYLRESARGEDEAKYKLKHPDPFKLSRLDGMRLTPIYGMPIISSYVGPLPAGLVTFTQARADFSKGIVSGDCPCFYQDDSGFMCVANDIDPYIPMLKSHPQVIGLDLSVQLDMPYATKVNNIYTNKVWTRYVQMKGVNAVANIIWADPRLYDLCFDGYPTNSIVAVNSMGIKGNRTSTFFWLKGYEEMLKRLSPSHIIRYGERISGEDESISTFYANNHLNRMRYGR